MPLAARAAPLAARAARAARAAPLAAPLAALALAALAACGGGAPSPTCTDGARNGAETAADCGGPACPPCADGLACLDARDCRSAVCAPGGACAAPTCADGTKNGQETGADCGGGCDPCAAGLACLVDGDCASGRCAGSVCLAGLGAGCAGDAACASGRCADGVCCESACAGTCEACNLPGRLGHCDPVPDGEDPAGECAAEPPASCGLDGACAGSRACRRWPAGTACLAGACLDPLTAQPGSSCDGQGACVAPATLPCAPLTCDPAGAACRTACADSTECAPGAACAPGGGCLRLDGQACAADGECLHGFCTDGVCCEARCGGACEACDQAGRAGFCDAVPAGADPAEECAATGAAGCGTTGACSGARACAVWPGGTLCAAATCTSATTSLQAARCDGAGSCANLGTVDCAPLRCDDPTGLCKTTCAGDADCAPGLTCAGGACRRTAGAACAADPECASGFCTDGVCCQARCGGACEACNLPGRAGGCDAIPAGQDPSSECADQGAASCGTSGWCDGARACARYAAGTTCAAATCAAGAATPARTCDGAGTCGAAAPVSCAPYLCGGDACATSCTVPADCAAGYACAGGLCKLQDGQACAAPTACASGSCADGYCCDAACVGTCRGCGEAGSIGRCVPLAAGTDPANECPADGCHAGVCDGTGRCAVAPAGTLCAPGKTCDAAGACLDVNECTSGAAACDANATCANTDGGYTCACNGGWLGDGTTCRRPASCAELQQRTPAAPSGLYAIDPDGPGGLPEFQAPCDMVTDGGGWTVFQRRQDATDFYRTYAEYQAGFGSPAGSFWLGLDRLAALTTTARTLRVELRPLAAPVTPYHAVYGTFRVAGAPDYVLTAAGYTGTAGDSLGINSGHGFSTKDRTAAGENPACAPSFLSGWWFQACTWVNVNGPFVPGSTGNDQMFWATMRTPFEPLSFSELKLR